MSLKEIEDSVFLKRSPFRYMQRVLSACGVKQSKKGVEKVFGKINEVNKKVGWEMSTFFLIYGIICVVVGVIFEISGRVGCDKNATAINGGIIIVLLGIMAVLLGIGIIIGRNEKSSYTIQAETQAELESEAIENYGDTPTDN